MPEFFEWIFGNLKDLLFQLLNFIIDVLNLIMEFLPRSPFRNINFEGLESIMANINWFIPVKGMIDITALWCTAIFTYYCYMHVMRLTKTIR